MLLINIMKNFKKMPKKQPLENKSQEKRENIFANSTPRRGSLPNYKRSTFSPNLDNFDETSEILEGLLNKGKGQASAYGDDLFRRTLEQKDHELANVLGVLKTKDHE